MPVVCGVFERAVSLTLVAASVASEICGSRATTKDSAGSTLTMTCGVSEAVPQLLLSKRNGRAGTYCLVDDSALVEAVLE